MPGTPQATGTISCASIVMNIVVKGCGEFFLACQKCRKFDVLGRLDEVAMFNLGGEMISCYQQSLVFSTVAVDRES